VTRHRTLFLTERGIYHQQVALEAELGITYAAPDALLAESDFVANSGLVK
jgi:7-keto-8-aminopelargonate synthetase-like enzyme